VENLPKIAKDGNLFAKKVTCRNIFGSNLILQDREARQSAPSGTEFPFKKHWAALCAAREMASKKPCQEMIREGFSSVCLRGGFQGKGC